MNKNAKLALYMKEHVSLYIFVAVILVTGVIFGAVMVNALTLEQKQELTRYLGNFFLTVDQNALGDAQASLQQSFAMHIKWVLIIWILGLSVIGLPLILILDFLKGVLVGFTVGYLAQQLSWKGMMFALVAVVPQNIVVIPVIVISSVTAMAFSIYLVKNRFMQRKGAISGQLVRYTATVLSLGAVLFGISLFETYVSPVMMKWVTPALVSLAS
ncbi:stage II sporulation protein M [Paenibacillus thalictri]|uniref:Stage II sporulation protein M n=1 Tax=Paenibacillus thalictri TaxID=2527873 RepID=A0A4V2J4H3_9BACL|nr:stage II sporulation protein M [Paenibacillus thalictri]TBL79822.1 stage II sporulation protein M [Paenibacillus thalictri]